MSGGDTPVQINPNLVGCCWVKEARPPNNGEFLGGDGKTSGVRGEEGGPRKDDPQKGRLCGGGKKKNRRNGLTQGKR